MAAVEVMTAARAQLEYTHLVRGGRSRYGLDAARALICEAQGVWNARMQERIADLRYSRDGRQRKEAQRLERVLVVRCIGVHLAACAQRTEAGAMNDGVRAEFRRMRMACEMSQLQLAEAVGVSRKTIARMESGEDGLSFDLLQSSAAVFGDEPLWSILRRVDDAGAKIAA